MHVCVGLVFFSTDFPVCITSLVLLICIINIVTGVCYILSTLVSVWRKQEREKVNNGVNKFIFTIVNSEPLLTEVN